MVLAQASDIQLSKKEKKELTETKQVIGWPESVSKFLGTA